ncbi:DUF3987 domain-containing protein, partial [Pseudomonas sp. NPDC098740]|uniref:DUF3987 domain-containing protein n=1 Tax=Pseudomonas sp. NPDC098740 TaxID=3364486 RepID=UPI00383B3D50
MQLCEAFEPPQPLLDYQQAPLLYPVEALGELLGPAVERLAEVIGVPCAMAAQSVLASAALVSQGHANVQLDGRTYPLSLYLLTVASSGDRKSAVDHLALKAARDWERQQWTLYAEKLKTYRAVTNIMAKPKTSKKPSEAEGGEVSEPVPPRVIIAEPTIEGRVLCLFHG